MRKYVLLFGLLLPLSAFAQKEVVPKGWKEVKACDFSFQIPIWMKEAKVHMIDSCLAAYSGRSTHLSLDYGWYSGPLSRPDEKMENYKSEKIRLDGREATLITYIDTRFKEKPKVTQVHIVTFPRKPDSEAKWLGDSMDTSLLFEIGTIRPKSEAMVKRIYDSIRYIGK